ncbi:hepatic leukemia factor-like isoform X3 [Daphnia pulex]|uniref:hepatic leukemia factor-like isoform X3 n=1 Tax=Daphnia pulex TaxID=6669 RepID=UPI001EDD9D29|nr:hepatic leukemia factor-like isoform X3 [Daphnia pulex]
MSSDLPPTGFGQYQTSAVASAQWNNWAHMLATNNNSQAIHAAMAVQRGGYNQHQLYSQSVPTSGVQSGWAQSPWGPWVQPHPQQNRFQQPIASQFPGPPPQMLHVEHSFRMCSLYPTDRLTSAPAVVPTQKIGSSVAPMMTTNTSPSRGGSNENGDKKKEESDEVWGYLEAQSSFLGPSLWDNGDLKMEYMDLDEFLSENGIPLGEGQGRSPPSKSLTPPRSIASADGSSGSGLVRSSLPSSGSESADSNKAGSSIGTPINYQSPVEIEQKDDECSNASESSNSTELDTVAPTSLEKARPPVGRRKRTAVSTCSSFNDNSSDDGSYVPGQEDFDPKSRQFSPEELRPQPMSKKSKKQYVPDDLKDDKYWARRRKNNMAAKRSRDARRVKENQIAMRANFLENKVNADLQAEVEKWKKLYYAALKSLEKYEKPGKK